MTLRPDTKKMGGPTRCAAGNNIACTSPENGELRWTTGTISHRDTFAHGNGASDHRILQINCLQTENCQKCVTFNLGLQVKTRGVACLTKRQLRNRMPLAVTLQTRSDSHHNPKWRSLAIKRRWPSPSKITLELLRWLLHREHSAKLSQYIVLNVMNAAPEALPQIVKYCLAGS